MENNIAKLLLKYSLFACIFLWGIASCKMFVSNKAISKATKIDSILVVKNCDSVGQYISKNWIYNENLKYYNTNNKFIDNILTENYRPIFQNCLIKKDKAEFMNSFGNPNRTDGNILDYFLNANCPYRNGCKYLEIRFDKDNKLNHIQLVHVGVRN